MLSIIMSMAISDQKTPKAQWKRENSAGGVVYKRTGRQIDILLINPKGPDFGPPTGKWTFPKGLLDHDGESKEQVAVREVREEGGVEARIQAPLGYIKFFRTSQYFGNALKFVDFYLMEYAAGDPADHDEEVAEAKWVPLEDVAATLAWKHDREIFERAVKLLLI